MSEISTGIGILLASSSPRRRQLIKALDLPVRMISPAIDEGPPRIGEAPHQFVVRQAREKAEWVAVMAGPSIILGADTTVVHDGDVLGKPGSKSEAIWMLKRLRDRIHTVITGVSVLDSRSTRTVSAYERTEVTARNYSDNELSEYVASGKAFDKAGAYGIQDQGFHPALRIVGCYLNVVGLPLCRVIELLASLGLQTQLKPGWRTPDQCLACPLEAVSKT